MTDEVKQDTRQCKHCHWSEGNEFLFGKLYCTMFKREARVPCGAWEREPGSDDE